MQRLEARHHLVNLILTHGRASSPADTMSNLRRRMNGDVQHPAFLQLLPQLLSLGVQVRSIDQQSVGHLKNLKAN